MGTLSQKEKEVVSDCKALLSYHSKGGRFDFWRINTSGTIRGGVLSPNMDSIGFSDFLILPIDTLPLFIEAKSSKGVLSDHQIEFRRRIWAVGYEYHVVRSSLELETILRDKKLIR